MEYTKELEQNTKDNYITLQKQSFQQHIKYNNKKTKIFLKFGITKSFCLYSFKNKAC